MLGEAGLAAHDARPKPRQTEARRRHRAGGHPGSGHGSLRHGPHVERGRAGPRQDAPGTHCQDDTRAAPMSPVTRAGQRPAASRGAKWSGGMRLFGDRNPRIVVLRREGRTFADAGGACRAVIRCALAGGAGNCDRPRQDRLPGLRRGFLALLRLIIRRARWALTLRSMTRTGRHVTQPGRIGEAK